MNLDQKIALWTAIAEGAAAIATFLAIVVAIWGNRLRQNLGLRPKLVVALNDPPSELTQVATKDKPLFPAWYYHVRVRNERSWAEAKNVRVVITHLFKPAADGSLVRQPLSGPLQLMWRFAVYKPLYMTLGPDEVCDLGHLHKGEHFRLTPYVYPSNFNGFLEANERLRVVIRAVADNAESEPFCVDISWDGQWADGKQEMSDHLVVREVTCPGKA